MGIGEEEQMIIGMKAIAAALGTTESILRKWLQRKGLRLPKVRSQGRSGAVYAFPSTIKLLKPHVSSANENRPRTA